MRLLYCSLLLAGVPLAQSLAGNYGNRELKLQLRDAGAGSYTGTLTLEGQSYPVTARGTAAQVQGEFTAAGNRFSFSAKADGL